jgi:peptidyl-prolyl cis-trans isomerase C
MKNMNIQKVVLSSLLVALALSISSVFALTVYVDGKAVDQQIINDDLKQFTQSSPYAATQLKNPQFRTQILNSIGIQQAILLEGKTENIENSKDYKMKLTQLKPMLYGQLLQQRIQQKPISQAELQAKYNMMKAAAMKPKTMYNVSHILVKDIATANKIEGLLKNNGDFAALAKQYSLDPGSKNNGGNLGWSDGSAFVPEFTNGFKTLKKGQYTMTPVKSPFGYHIIKLVDIKTQTGASSFASFASMKQQITQQIQNDNVRAFFDGLKQKYHVEVK